MVLTFFQATHRTTAIMRDKPTRQSSESSTILERPSHVPEGEIDGLEGHRHADGRALPHHQVHVARHGVRTAAGRQPAKVLEERRRHEGPDTAAHTCRSEGLQEVDSLIISPVKAAAKNPLQTSQYYSPLLRSNRWRPEMVSESTCTLTGAASSSIVAWHGGKPRK